ncbi:hypothetical protein HGM15179_015919, partial [Zosterops borbonicus]
ECNMLVSPLSSEHFFQQLCATHCLLEALALKSNSLTHSILTCWNPRGRSKVLGIFCPLYSQTSSIASSSLIAFQKYQALKQMKYFGSDMERLRQLGMRTERERGEDGFPALLARLPECAKGDHYVLAALQVCSPELLQL